MKIGFEGEHDWFFFSGFGFIVVLRNTFVVNILGSLYRHVFMYTCFYISSLTYIASGR